MPKATTYMTARTFVNLLVLLQSITSSTWLAAESETRGTGFTSWMLYLQYGPDAGTCPLGWKVTVYVLPWIRSTASVADMETTSQPTQCKYTSLGWTVEGLVPPVPVDWVIFAACVEDKGDVLLSGGWLSLQEEEEDSRHEWQQLGDDSDDDLIEMLVQGWFTSGVQQACMEAPSPKLASAARAEHWSTGTQDGRGNGDVYVMGGAFHESLGNILFSNTLEVLRANSEQFTIITIKQPLLKFGSVAGVVVEEHCIMVMPMRSHGSGQDTKLFDPGYEPDDTMVIIHTHPNSADDIKLSTKKINLYRSYPYGVQAEKVQL